MSYKEHLSKDLLIRQQRLQNAMQSMNIEGCILTTAVNVFYMT